MTAVFDVERYLNDFGLNFKPKPGKNGSTIYVLDVCPFDSSHTKGESSIIKTGNGTLYFQCFHNSCQRRTWHDFRKLKSGDQKLGSYYSGGEKVPLPPGKNEEKKSDHIKDHQKIEIINLAQIIELDPQIDPIAEGIINRREPVIIHAAGGTGKSTMAHQMAEELARPVNMYDNMLLDTFPIRQAGCQSIFIQSENSMAAVNAKSRSCDPEIASRIWYPKIYDDIITTGGAFEDQEFIQRVIDVVNAIKDQTGSKVDLLFVDPLISFNRAEENGAGDMRAALDGITQVMQQTEVTPIVLHHDRKEGDDYRGSTAINDWCRCRVHLKQKFIGEDRITDMDPDNRPIMRTARIPAIEVVHTKANNMALFESFTMVLNKKLKFVKVDDPMDPEVRERGIAVQQALKDMGGLAESNRALAKSVSELTGKGTSTCKGYIAQAVKRGFIVAKTDKAGDGRANAYSYILAE